MKLLSALKEGGKEFPLWDIKLLHGNGGHLTVFFESGKTAVDWCSLVKARAALQAHRIPMLRVGRNLLISYSIINYIEKGRKIKLKDKFLQNIPKHWQERFNNITASAEDKKNYEKFILAQSSQPVQSSSDIIWEKFNTFNSTGGILTKENINYIYKQRIPEIMKALMSLLSSKDSSNT
jgi:hypothetical protein